MSASGATPILVYGSTTTLAVPSAANLYTGANGVELAMNATDGKLYYKDNNGVVQLLAVKGGGTGATGAGGDNVFVENDELVTTSYTIGAGAMVAGVTVTIASPAVFTLANHGYVAGQPVRLTTTGALPTGLSTNAQYFVLAPTTNTFNLALTSGGAAINTSGTQSGVHSVGKSKNASLIGPLVVPSGVTVTVPSGSRLVVQ